MAKGDTLSVTYTDKSSNVMTLESIPIDSDQIIDTIKLFSFENDFGLSGGYAVILGKS
jgi:hypothetical protein